MYSLVADAPLVEYVSVDSLRKRAAQTAPRRSSSSTGTWIPPRSPRAENVSLATPPFTLWRIAAETIRAAAPDDVTGQLYCVSLSDLPAEKFATRCGSSWLGATTNWGAYTFVGGCDELRPYIDAAGQWRGPGIGIVFRETARADGFIPGLATMVHEIAHHLPGRAVDTVLKFRLLREAFAEQVQTDPLFAAYWTRAPQGDNAHGAPFIRAAIHLWHRTNKRHAFDVAQCVIAPRADLFALSLAGELESRRQETISHILLSDPPRPFALYWKEVVDSQ